MAALRHPDGGDCQLLSCQLNMQLLSTTHAYRQIWGCCRLVPARPSTMQRRSAQQYKWPRWLRCRRGEDPAAGFGMTGLAHVQVGQCCGRQQLRLAVT